MKQKFDARVSGAAADMAAKLGIGNDVAEKLVAAGMNDVEIIADCSPDDVIGVTEMTAADAEKIIATAKNAASH